MKKIVITLLTVMMAMIWTMVPISAYGFTDGYYYDGYYYDDYYYEPDSEDSGMGIGEVVIVSIIAGFGISFALVSVKKRAMKTVKPEKTANEYVLRESLNLAVRDDVFIRAHTTRTPRKQNNRK